MTEGDWIIVFLLMNAVVALLIYRNLEK